VRNPYASTKKKERRGGKKKKKKKRRTPWCPQLVWSLGQKGGGEKKKGKKGEGPLGNNPLATALSLPNSTQRRGKKSWEKEKRRGKGTTLCMVSRQVNFRSFHSLDPVGERKKEGKARKKKKKRRRRKRPTESGELAAALGRIPERPGWEGGGGKTEGKKRKKRKLTRIAISPVIIPNDGGAGGGEKGKNEEGKKGRKENRGEWTGPSKHKVGGSSGLGAMRGPPKGGEKLKEGEKKGTASTVFAKHVPINGARNGKVGRGGKEEKY